MTGTNVHSVRARAFTVPTDSPEGDGTLAWSATTLVLVEVSAEESTGLGWTYAPAAAADLVGEVLAEEVLGADPMNVPAVFGSMVRAARNAGRPGTLGYAISAVDSALWDLKARLLGLPLHRLLGSVRESVPIYGSGGFTTYPPERMREQLSGWTEQRIPRVKIKIGTSWGADLDGDRERIKRAREVIGPDVELYVDANGAYTAKQAIRLARSVADCDLRWFEEPVSSDDLDGLARVRAGVQADVAAGEYGYDLTYFRRMCAAGAVDCLQADVTRCGGISEFLRIAAVAAGYQLQVSGHCAPHMHVHVAAAIPNFRHLEWFHDHVRIEGMFFDGTLDPFGGTLSPSPAPGNGLALREQDARRYQTGGTVERRLDRVGSRS